MPECRLPVHMCASCGLMHRASASALTLGDMLMHRASPPESRLGDTVMHRASLSSTPISRRPIHHDPPSPFRSSVGSDARCIAAKKALRWCGDAWCITALPQGESVRT